MFQTRPQLCSGLPKTTTIFCKALRLPISGLPDKQKIILMPGFSKMVYAGRLKVVPWPPVVLTLLSSVCCLIALHFLYSTCQISDDPQMPGLIPLIKRIRPDLPIVYRSHIEIRSDLVHVPGSPQEEVWKYLWNTIQLADLFISKYFHFFKGYSLNM